MTLARNAMGAINNHVHAPFAPAFFPRVLSLIWPVCENTALYLSLIYALTSLLTELDG